jgi:hypothetical protein
MDKLDPMDMTICPGPGKELKITKEAVMLILGLPSTDVKLMQRQISDVI